jgi:hypothetical protein
VKVLGIDVSPTVLNQWRDWYAPEVQPFFVESKRGLPKSLDVTFTPETRDSFKAWSPANRGKAVIWLDDELASDASLPFRHATIADVLTFVIAEAGVDHHHVRGEPSFAGTFPAGSGPNCFGTTMGAAGVAGAENEWVLIEPFERWLCANCRPGGRDDDVGTVLVWRDTSNGQPWHSALALGDGWACEKASQCWWSPRYVASVGDIKRVSRGRGLRLERWRPIA